MNSPPEEPNLRQGGAALPTMSPETLNTYNGRFPDSYILLIGMFKTYEESHEGYAY